MPFLNQKSVFSHAVAGEGFDRVGWTPEGGVFFNYAVEINGAADQYTASASADIDNDATAQIWGYRKGALDGKDHGAPLETCTSVGIGESAVVKACDTTSGNSTF
jgi:hypothetical protein